MAILDCRADVHADGHQYTVRATTLPPAGDEGERIEVALTGPDATGAITVPPGALGAIGKLINQVMSGLSTLNGRGAAPSPVNAQAPWTKEQDDELRERWLTAGDTFGATRLRRDLAAHFGRTTGAIRARLLKVGCDPDAPGHCLANHDEGVPEPSEARRSRG